MHQTAWQAFDSDSKHGVLLEDDNIIRYKVASLEAKCSNVVTEQLCIVCCTTFAKCQLALFTVEHLERVRLKCSTQLRCISPLHAAPKQQTYSQIANLPPFSRVQKVPLK